MGRIIGILMLVWFGGAALYGVGMTKAISSGGLAAESATSETFDIAPDLALPKIKAVDLPKFVREQVQQAPGLYVTKLDGVGRGVRWEFKQNGHPILNISATLTDTGDGGSKLDVTPSIYDGARAHATGEFGDSLEAYGKVSALIVRKKMAAALGGPAFTPKMEDDVEGLAELIVMIGTPSDRSTR